MINKYFIFSAFILLLISCSNKKTIDSIDEKKMLYFTDEKATNLNPDSLRPERVVKLEITDNSLVSNTNLLLFSNRSFFVLNNINGTVIRFDENGQYLNEIGRVGKGPGEYIEPCDFLSNEIDSTLEILALNAIYIYSYNGKYIKTKPTKDIPSTSFAKDDLGNYWFSTGNNLAYSEYKLHKYTVSKEIEHYIKSENSLLPVQEKSIVNNKTYAITYYESLYNDVYKTTKDSVDISYRIDFGKYNLSDKLQDKTTSQLMELLHKNDYCQIRNYFENEEYAYFYIFRNLTSESKIDFFHWLLHKKTNKNYLIRVAPQSMNHYLLYPKAITEDNELMFLGSTNQNMGEENPSIVFVPIKSLIEYAE